MSEGFLSQEEIDALLRGDSISSPIVAGLLVFWGLLQVFIFTLIL